MRIKKQILVVLLVFLLLYLIHVYVSHNREQHESTRSASTPDWSAVLPNRTERHTDELNRREIVIAVVACGMRLQETLNMIKSAIIFARENPLKFVVITESNLMTGFREKLEDWQGVARQKFTFEILPLTFPKQNEREWKSLFKPCSAQRLFLPAIIENVDSVLYVDTDTLFLSPVRNTWQFFDKFNETQIAALSPEHEDRNVGWYNRFARHPYYGPLGVNSGVMLMNLTRMRQFRWNDYMLPLHNEYKLKITWGDQDLINILFYFHPDKLYVFPCQFNYRPDHCMYMSVCKAQNGVQILHGNRGYFHADKQPVFSIIYRLIEEYQLGTDVYQNLLMPLESALADETVQKTNCGKVSDLFLVQMKEVFKEATDYYYSQ